jgi:multisubunit Na+/H+ antiporter MnhG subunit
VSGSVGMVRRFLRRRQARRSPHKRGIILIFFGFFDHFLTVKLPFQDLSEKSATFA